MKQPNARPAGKLHGATRGLNSPRGRLLDLDDDIFFPAEPRPVVRQPAAVSAPRVDVFSSAARRNDASVAASIEPSRAKAGSSAAEIRVDRLEKTIEEQSQKLSSCHDLILELSTKRDQQAHDLQSARQGIEVLEQSLVTQRGAASKRDSELVAAIEKLNVYEKERLALQAQVHSTHRDYMQVADKLLVSETTLNDQSAIAAAAQETIDRSSAELELCKFQIVALDAELKSTQEQRSELRQQAAQCQSEFDEQAAQFRSELSEQATRLGEQEALSQSELDEQEALFRGKLGEQENLFQGKLSEQEILFRTTLGEQHTLFRSKLDEQEKLLGEKENLFRGKLSEQEALFQSKLGEQEKLLGEQENLFRGKLGEQETLFRTTLGEQDTFFRRKLGEQEKLLGEQENLFQGKLSEQEALFQITLGEQDTFFRSKLDDQEKLLGEQENLFRGKLSAQEAIFRSKLGEQEQLLGQRENLFRGKLSEQEALFRSKLGEQEKLLGQQENLFRDKLSEQDALFRSTLGEQEKLLGHQENLFRGKLSEQEALFRNKLGEQQKLLGEQEYRFRRELGEKEARFRSELGEQESRFRSELGVQEIQFRSELGEQTARFQKEIEVAKGISLESLRQAAMLAQDRAALHQRCEELSRTVNLLQVARRKMSSELQINAGDLGQLYADLSEMKASHDAIASKFAHAESKLSVMRLHVEKLETSDAILARYDTALVDSAAANGSTPEQTRESMKYKDEIFDLLEAYFEKRPASDRRAASSQGTTSSLEVISWPDVVSGQELPEANNRPLAEAPTGIQEGQPLEASRDRIPSAEFQFAEFPFNSRDEQSADIIKLETAARGKKVA